MQGVVLGNGQKIISRTQFGMAVLVKYWFASIALMSALGFSKGIFEYPGRIVVIGPLTYLGILCLTAAEVRAEENVLKYRRFISWKHISYKNIKKCENSWCPWLGYLSLDHFLFPLGKVYFVKLRPAFSGNPKGLIDFINARRAGGRHSL